MLVLLLVMVVLEVEVMVLSSQVQTGKVLLVLLTLEVEVVLRPARTDQATAAKLSRKALIVASMSASE